MADLSSLDANVFEQMLHEIFLPNFLRIVLPFLCIILIFGILRIIFRLLLEKSRRAAILVDALLCLGFLVTCGFVGVPVVQYLIKNTEIPDKEYNLAVNADGSPFEYIDPFDPENWQDAAEGVEFTDPFAWDSSSSATERTPSSKVKEFSTEQDVPYNPNELRESLEEGQEEHNKNTGHDDWHLFDPFDYEFTPADTDYSYDPLEGFDSSDLSIPQEFPELSSTGE